MKAHETLRNYAAKFQSFEFIDFYEQFCEYSPVANARVETQYRCPSLLKDPSSGRDELLFEMDGVHLTWPGSRALYEPYKKVLDGIQHLV